MIVCFLLFAAMFVSCLTAMPVDNDIPVTPQQFDEGRQFQVFKLKNSGIQEFFKILTGRVLPFICFHLWARQKITKQFCLNEVYELKS